MILVNT